MKTDFWCFVRRKKTEDIELDANKNKETKKEAGSRFWQIFATFSGAITFFEMGTEAAWPSPSLIYLARNDSEIPISIQESAWIASSPNLGGLVGIITVFFLMDHLGRKKILIIYALPHTISWLLFIFGKNFAVLCTARVISGFGCANIPVVVVYLAEISEKNMRGSLTVLTIVFYDLGVFSLNLMSAYLSYHYMNIVLIIPSILYLISTLFLPESPSFLLMKNRNEEAVKNLMKFRGKTNPKSVDDEVQEIRKLTSESMENNKIDFLELFRSKSNRKAFMITLLANMTNLFSGSIVLTVYTQEIFERSGFSLSPAYSAALIGGIKLISGLVLSRFIDKGGRKIFFLCSGVLCSISLAVIGSFFFLKFKTEIDVSDVSWIPLVGLLFFNIGCPLGITKIPYILNGEIFSMSVKKTAVTIIHINSCFVLFSLKFIFPILNDAAGVHSSFFMFATVCLIGTFTFFVVAPETKGKSLNEIQAILKSK